jgi:predicted dinucleotide-binding enzyme
MSITVIGAGRIGTVLARLLVGAGQEVNIAGRRGPQALLPLVGELGSAATALVTEEAVRAGDMVVLMVPYGQVPGLFPADLVKGKILIDATNAFPARAAGDDRTSSERIAAVYPGARLVKSLNTMNYAALGETAGRDGGERMTHFVAGDDPQAKKAVQALITDLGFAVLDTGSLREGGKQQEPGGRLYNVLLTEAEAKKLLTGVATDG